RRTWSRRDRRAAGPPSCPHVRPSSPSREAPDGRNRGWDELPRLDFTYRPARPILPPSRGEVAPKAPEGAEGSRVQVVGPAAPPRRQRAYALQVGPLQRQLPPVVAAEPVDEG